jgi:hypothetical protein
VSALYAYGVRRAADAAPLDPDLRGVGGGAFFHLPVGDLAVLAGEHDGSELRRARRHMLAHLKVLEAAMAAGPILPMRFGVIAASPEEIVAVIAPRADELRALLDKLEGCAEFGLRVSWPREAAMAALARARPDLVERRMALSAAGGADRNALIALGQAVADALEDRRKAAERALVATLRPLAADHVLRAPEDDVEALRAEFLVPLSKEESFAKAAEAAAAALDFAGGAAPTIRIVGPAPAYNFVSLHLAQTEAA